MKKTFVSAVVLIFMFGLIGSAWGACHPGRTKVISKGGGSLFMWVYGYGDSRKEAKRNLAKHGDAIEESYSSNLEVYERLQSGVKSDGPYYAEALFDWRGSVCEMDSNEYAYKAYQKYRFVAR